MDYSLDVLQRVCALQDTMLQAGGAGRAVFEGLLSHLVDFTESEAGFIGEVAYEDGQPVLYSQAASDLAWDEASRAVHAAAMRGEKPMVFRKLDTLYGQVLRTGERFISNDAQHDPLRGGTPPGHPPLLTFAGLPVRVAGRFVGMLGLANRRGGYSEELVSSLTPLLSTASSLFYLLETQRQRAAAEASVARRLTFERLILEISTHFIHTDATDFDRLVSTALERVGRFVEADRSYLFLLREDERLMDNTHEWCAEGIPAERDNLQAFPVAEMGYALAPLHEGRPVVIPDVSALPPSDEGVRQVLEAQSIRSLLLVPLTDRGRLRGFVGFDAVRTSRSWTDDDAALLQVLSEDIGHLLRRTQTDARLAESERRLRLIAAHVPQAFFLVSHDYRRMDYVSPAFETLWGLPCEAVMADPLLWLASVDETQREQVAASLASSGRQETLSEYRIIRPDGTDRWVRVQTVPVRGPGGETEQIAGIAEDVTEQRLVAETLARHSEALEEAVRVRTEELRRSNTALRTVAESMPVAVLIVDEDEVRFANPSAQTLLGVQVGAKLGEDQPALSEAAHIDVGYREVQVLRGDGLPRDVRVLARPVDFEGRPGHLLAALDVTEQRRAERMLREHHNTIARLAHIGNMEGLASAVAHELNQPLAVIVSSTGGLQARLARGTLSPQDLDEVLERLRTQALRAGELMRRLRGFSARGAVQRLLLAVDALCTRVVAQLEEQTSARSVRVELDLQADGASVIGDTVQLEIVLTNLLRNGMDAMEELAPDERLLAMSTRRVDDGVQITVRDRGAGVHEALRTTIFDPLVSTKADGLGIGLSIARSIVEAHRGRIVLGEPTAQEPGACFTVTLPEALGSSDA